MGLNTIVALVYSAQIFSEYENSDNLPFSIKKYWDHSIQVSRFSKMISIALGLSKQQQEYAQISGLLHDIGKLLGLKIPEYNERFVNRNDIKSIFEEYELLGTSHAELGAYLLGIWGLPIPIVENVLLHHQPAEKLSVSLNSLTSLHIANGLVNMYEQSEVDSFKDYIDLEYLKTVLGVENIEDTLEPFFKTISDEIDNM